MSRSSVSTAGPAEARSLRWVRPLCLPQSATSVPWAGRGRSPSGNVIRPWPTGGETNVLLGDNAYGAETPQVKGGEGE